MKDLLVSIVKGLVEKPEEISVTVDEKNEEGIIVYHLHVAEEDMGRVIGRQGRIAKAIRTVMRAAASRNDEKIQVEID
ncbi:MAG: KH domain-containing protein [Clostridia bacterium]|nr:KH domain-containing protein [Clostridia bacterium]